MRTLTSLIAASLLAAPFSAFACGGMEPDTMGYEWVTMRGRGMYVQKLSRRHMLMALREIRTSGAPGHRL